MGILRYRRDTYADTSLDVYTAETEGSLTLGSYHDMPNVRSMLFSLEDSSGYPLHDRELTDVVLPEVVDDPRRAFDQFTAVVVWRVTGREVLSHRQKLAVELLPATRSREDRRKLP